MFAWLFLDKSIKKPFISYLNNELGYSDSQSSFIGIVATFALLLPIPFIGLLADGLDWQPDDTGLVYDGSGVYWLACAYSCTRPYR